MSKERNFRPHLVEAPRLGVELEFHEKISGLNGDTIIIYLNENATVETADTLIELLARFGSDIKISNSR